MGFWYLHVLVILPGCACFGTVDVGAGCTSLWTAARPSSASTHGRRITAQQYQNKMPAGAHLQRIISYRFNTACQRIATIADKPARRLYTV